VNDYRPTWLHFFLVATPGSWQPVTFRSDRPEPDTDDELSHLQKDVAAEIGTPEQFVRYRGSHCLINQPYEEPEHKERETTHTPNRNPIVVPNTSLIVPPGVRR
jgi:hypothetical protein